MATAMAEHRASGQTLPDVNAETYPFDVVQRLLDQTADLLVFAVPDEAHADSATLTPNDPSDYFGLNGGYGLDLKSTLHQFRSAARSPADQAVGGVVGSFRGLWLFCPDDAGWATDRYPPPALFDPSRPQRFAVQRAEFAFDGCKERLKGYGLGRTYPVTIDGRPVTLAGAVGTVLEGEGRMRGLEGTFVMTGLVTEELGFRGTITCRLVDPKGAVRGGRELPKMKQAAVSTHGSTFVVIRGEKRDRTVKTMYGPSPNDAQVSLVTPSVMRGVEFSASAGGGRLRAGTKLGPSVGEFTATVAFDVTAPPGTAAAPVPFTTDEEYTFRDEDGNVVGTVRAAVAEGHSFGLTFPAASGQPGVRFGGVGPILDGTGCFAGAKGMLGVNSLIGIAPHALSLVHTLHLVTPGAVRPPASPSHPSEPTGRFYPRFRPNLEYLDEFIPQYVGWRSLFRRCSRPLTELLVTVFNGLLDVGDFPGLAIDPGALRAALEADVKPFDAETFERYRGPAKGMFKTYDRHTREGTGSSVLYSYWGEDTLRIGDRLVKQITGSDVGYVEPARVASVPADSIDLLVNSYHPATGLTSWVEIYQRQRQQRTSFGYKLPHPHEIMWVVKDVSLDGHPVRNNVFMFSHEWKGQRDGAMSYYMVGVFVDVDPDTCVCRLSGDMFWKALYEEVGGRRSPGGIAR